MRTYLICSFSFEKKTLPNEFYVIDRRSKKVLTYRFYHDCKDETKFLQKMWEDEQKHSYDKKIGCELIDVLNGEEPNGFLKTILATDDVRKAINKVCELRAKWFAIRLKRLEHLANSNSCGWEDGTDEDFIAGHFGNL